MRRVYDDHSSLRTAFASAARETAEKFTWEAAAKQVLSLL